MQQVRLNLENLRQLGFGVVNEAFDREMQLLVKDCEDRPLEERPRELTIKFKACPKVDKTGGQATCDGVALEVEIQGKTPVRRTRVFDLKPRQDGSLFFHPDLPESADGDALYDADTLARERKAKQAT